MIAGPAINLLDRGYLTLQPLSMLWQCPLPLQVGQWQSQDTCACGAGRGAGG